MGDWCTTPPTRFHGRSLFFDTETLKRTVLTHSNIKTESNYKPVAPLTQTLRLGAPRFTEGNSLPLAPGVVDTPTKTSRTHALKPGCNSNGGSIFHTLLKDPKAQIGRESWSIPAETAQSRLAVVLRPPRPRPPNVPDLPPLRVRGTSASS